MISTEKLEIILDKCQIMKLYTSMPEAALGHYHGDENYYIILINEKIRHDERLYRTVLAEEIGHYRTTIGDATPRRYMCYSKRVVLDKNELKALKWATDFLIPNDKLIQAIKDKVAISFEELIDHFFVTEEFMMLKLKFMAKQKQYWEIDYKRYLCLHNLPTVSIFDKM